MLKMLKYRLNNMSGTGLKFSDTLVVILLLALSLGDVQGQAECSMNVRDGYGIESDYFKAEPGYPTKEQCYEYCRTKTECVVAGYYDDGACYWSSTNLDLYEDGSYRSAVKVCPTTSTTTTTTTTPTTASTTTTPTTTSTTTTPTTTSTTAPASCSPSVFQDTDSDTASIALAISGAGDCHTACKLVQECSNYVYSSSTCSLYTSSSDVTSLAGSELGNKINCPDGSHCCFDTKSDTTLNAGTLLARLILSQASCEQACAMLSNCRAVVFTGSTCKVYLTDPVKVSRPGLVMSVKSCSQGSVILRAECNNARSSLSYFNLLMAVVTAAFSVLVLQI